MKKLILLLALTSCTTKNKIYYSKNVDKCIHNLNEMQIWLMQDYQNGDIPKHVAQNYMLVIINTKCSLSLKYAKKTKDCAD